MKVMSFVSLSKYSLMWVLPTASAWSNFGSQLNISVNSNAVQQVVTESTTLWPTDPICELVAATNIALLYPPPQWSCNASGSTDSDPCTWNGITCDQQSKQIISIVQGELSLTGTLAPLLGDISTIESIAIYRTSIFGTLPSSWSSLTSLKTLNLNQNSLSGTLPASWSTLTGVQSLDLHQNLLSATLPASWSSLKAMNSLYLYQNSLFGTLPASWNSLISIVSLELSENSLSGPLPSSWSSLVLMGSMDLHQNSLSGTLPASWSSLIEMGSLDLHQNFFSGTLPASWNSLISMVSLELSENSLSGTLPSLWSSLNSLLYLFLNDNSFSSSVPSSWISLTGMIDLSLSRNRLIGSIPSCLDSMYELQYLYISDNCFSGPLPTSWASNVLRTLDMSNNSFNGSLQTEGFAYPDSLNSLNVAFNSLTGTVPPAVALFGNISYLNISNNDNIVGSIPSEFCSNSGVSIDVGGTGIDCYSGCLTSSFVLVEGASPDCHDGSIMERFVIISGAIATIAVVCMALHRWHGWWSPVFASLGRKTPCGLLNMFGYILSWFRYLVAESGGADEHIAAAYNRKKVPISYTVFGMAMAKFLLGLVVSLTLNNWWTYNGGPGVARNNDVLASCSNPTVGNCFSFCDEVHVITVNVTTDDVVFDDDLLDAPTGHSIPHVQSASYCTAVLPGYCGYQVWLSLKLPPILLQFLGLLLTIVLWYHGSDDFFATPQRAQYNLILDRLYPQICLAGVNRTMQTENKTVLPPEVTLSLRFSLMRQLATPFFPSIFWFLELVTVIYVWSGLVFPPVYCGSVPPLSLYYYPIMMSLLDLMKLNIYTSVQLWKAKRHVESVLILFDLQLFATHLWVTVAMGLIFGVGVIYDCLFGLLWCMEIAMGRREKLEWAGESKSAAVKIAMVATTATDSTATSSVSVEVTSNPMLLLDTANDVELAAH